MTEATEATEIEVPNEHITVRKDGSLVKIDHVTPEAEAGFDLTTFGTAKNFEGLLMDLELNTDAELRDYDPEFTAVNKRPDQPERNYRSFVWANEDLMLITGNNPITGQHANPDMRPPEKGYASYIGLSGKPEAVRKARQKIREAADHVKAENPDSREFI